MQQYKYFAHSIELQRDLQRIETTVRRNRKYMEVQEANRCGVLMMSGGGGGDGGERTMTMEEEDEHKLRELQQQDDSTGTGTTNIKRHAIRALLHRQTDALQEESDRLNEQLLQTLADSTRIQEQYNAADAAIAAMAATTSITVTGKGAAGAGAAASAAAAAAASRRVHQQKRRAAETRLRELQVRKETITGRSTVES